MKKLLTTKDFREIQMVFDDYRENLSNKISKLEEKDNPNEDLIQEYEEKIQKIAEAQELIQEVINS